MERDSNLFGEYAKRFVFAAWYASQQAQLTDVAAFREQQRRLLPLLVAMVETRARCPAGFPEIDGRLRRLAAQAVRFVMCDPANTRSARSSARRLGERAFPLMHHFSGSPDGPSSARRAANGPADGTVIRIDFRARQRC